MRKFQKGSIISKPGKTGPIYPNYDSECQNKLNQHTYRQIIGVWIFDEFRKRADWALVQK